MATLGMVGCSGDGMVEFQPQDELDKAALAVAKEKYPNEKFYRHFSLALNDDKTKSKADYFGKNYDYHYHFIYFKDKNDKDKRFVIGIKCLSTSNECVLSSGEDGEDSIGNARKQGRTK